MFFTASLYSHSKQILVNYRASLVLLMQVASNFDLHLLSVDSKLDRRWLLQSLYIYLQFGKMRRPGIAVLIAHPKQRVVS